MGKIVIEEMEFYAFHGHYQEEQIVGNRFLVDLELEADLAAPAESDNLEDAVNYQQAYMIIKNEMRRTKSNLLENIGKRILEALYAEMTGIKKVGVCGGAGTMGAGIAIVAARAGFERCVRDGYSNADRLRGVIAYIRPMIEHNEGRNPAAG